MGEIVYGGLTLVMFQYGHMVQNPCLNEKDDKDLFEPDGKIIAFVLSNYCCKYHPDYVHLSKEYIEENKRKFKEYNNNRGRKKKERIKKNKRVDGGSNTQFGSCIVFGVIHGEKVHGIKVFRTTSGNISKLSHDEANSPEYIKSLLEKLFAFINERKPIGIVYISHNVTLTNMTAKYNLPDGHIIQLYELRRLLDYNPYNSNYWGEHNVMFNYNGKVNHLVVSVYIGDSRIISIEICPEGNIHVYGGNDIVRTREFMTLAIGMLDALRDQIVIRGYRASSKAKPRPDFSTFVVPTK